jgi:hypothetical protein
MSQIWSERCLVGVGTLPTAGKTKERPMPGTFRIPQAVMTGLYGKVMSAYARRAFGQVPDNAYVYVHHKDVLAFEGKVKKRDRLYATPSRTPS